jgi:autotransporter-associated beta strand protein
MKFLFALATSVLLISTGWSQDPTNQFIWAGAAQPNQFWHNPANWVGNVAPKAGSSNIIVFRGDIGVPYNWPHIMTNYGTTILIFSNDIRLNGIKILAGSNNTVNLGSYILQDQPADAQSPSYFGIDSPIEISYRGTKYWVTNYNFTNALGDASCGSQTDFRCIGNRLDVYGVLKDGAGTSSRLVKSGNRTLNITGMKANLYTGGTIVNAGPIKMQKPAGVNAIPGDVTVNGTGGLVINILGGEQIANSSVVTLNDSGYFDLIDQPETVRAIQSTGPNSSIMNVGSTLTVAPLSGGTYNGGVGVSDFAGSIGGTGTVRMNGTGTYGMLGANAVANLIVNSGTLKVNGNTGTGAVTVNSGGTLLGKGTIAGAVTVASGGSISAGFGSGQLTLSAGLDLSASGDGATNVWELAALKDDATGVAGTDFDRIVISGGALALGDAATLDIRFIGSASAPDASNPFWQSAHTWTIISLNGGSNPGSSCFGWVKNGSYSTGYFAAAADGGGNIVLTYTPTIAPPMTPPSITQQPSNQSIAAGGDASFSILAQGSEPLNYRWQKNSINLDNGGHYSGVTTPTLTITSADTNDVADYRCVVTNAFGSTNSSPATLTVIIPSACTSIRNPGCEDGFVLAGGGYIATNWTEWEASPGVVIGYDETAIVLDGAHSQRIRVSSTNATSGGIYQRVPVTAGGAYVVSVWVYADNNLTECALGVDPAGGTNATSGVAWLPASTNVAWVPQSWSGTATASCLTVFYKVTSPDNVKRNGYFDGATLATSSRSLQLATQRNGNELILTWPECPTARLEQADSWTLPMSWATVTNQVSIVSGQKSVTLVPTGSAGYFRLALE